MRIRSIKPEFWRSQDVSGLSVEDRLFFIGLWSYVDDNSVGEDRASQIAADLFADDVERDPSGTFARVSRGLQNLSERGLITRYTVQNRAYLRIVNWSKHQRIDKPNKPRYPFENGEILRELDISATPSRDSRDTLAPGAGEQGNKGTEEQGRGSGAPARRCKRHSHWENSESCGACGRDRIAFEKWEAEQAEAAKPKRPKRVCEHGFGRGDCGIEGCDFEVQQTIDTEVMT